MRVLLCYFVDSNLVKISIIISYKSSSVSLKPSLHHLLIIPDNPSIQNSNEYANCRSIVVPRSISWSVINFIKISLFKLESSIFLYKLHIRN